MSQFLPEDIAFKIVNGYCVGFHDCTHEEFTENTMNMIHTYSLPISDTILTAVFGDNTTVYFDGLQFFSKSA